MKDLPNHPKFNVNVEDHSEHNNAKFNTKPGDKVIEFYGHIRKNSDKGEAHKYMQDVEAHMNKQGYSAIDRDDNSDINDLSAHTHFRKK